MNPAPTWSRLDNVGKLFPAVFSDRLTNLFRLSVTLKTNVSQVFLQEALGNILPLFPYYQVKLRGGWFWYSLIHDQKVHQVIPDGAYPCMPLTKDLPEEHLFRVRYYGKRFAVEFNHALTDGTGALIFLTHLLGEYLFLKGSLQERYSPWEVGRLSHPHAWEDAFTHHHNKIPSPPTLPKAFRIPGKLLPKGKYYATTGYLSVDGVKKLSKSYGVTITEFFFGHLFKSYMNLQDDLMRYNSKKKKPITLYCPVNLRNFFPSGTMRNYFLAVPLTIDPRLGNYTLEEVFKRVHDLLALEIDRRILKQRIVHNRKGELIFLARLLPLFIKNWIIGIAFSQGSREISGSLSNLGQVNLPPNWSTEVDSFEFLPPPNHITKTAMSIISYGDKLAVSMGRLIPEPELERRFFTSLRKAGLHIKIESNYGE